MHVLPQLRELEVRYPDVLAVIGVHTAKFTTEAEQANLRQAVLRYDIRHPVVNDRDYRIWQDYAVSAWPTAVFVDPAGRVVGMHAGEFQAPDFIPYIAEMLTAYANKLDRAALPLALEQEWEPERQLAFPGKVLADPDGGRLFLADSGHHRILVTDLNGQVRQVIGSGNPGMRDGEAAVATFRMPQGMAVQGDTLYVADMGNHVIRRVDLRTGQVERVAGTGEPARLSRRGGPALKTPLSSPWDLALAGERLFIALAGTHQIWVLDTANGELQRLAGTGREALADGSLARCALAQPSGLALSGDQLYFADSESSAIRVADLQAGQTRTLVGAGLFDFGDQDGVGDAVRLQHSLGVAVHGDRLLVADTYNNRIKGIDPRRREARSFAGTGEAGLQDGPGAQARFWEPGGLSVAGNRLYIADTNNHAVRIANLDDGAVTTLPLTGLPPTG